MHNYCSTERSDINIINTSGLERHSGTAIYNPPFLTAENIGMSKNFVWKVMRNVVLIACFRYCEYSIIIFASCYNDKQLLFIYAYMLQLSWIISNNWKCIYVAFLTDTRFVQFVDNHQLTCDWRFSEEQFSRSWRKQSLIDLGEIWHIPPGSES